jgi:hypothetical protein
MIYTPPLPVLQGSLIIFFGILTITYVRSSYETDVHGVFLAGSSRERLIKGLASRSSDDSIGWSFVPRDFLDELPINEAKNPRSIQPISAAAWNGTSAYNQAGTSGVAAMQLSVIDDQFVILFDKAEHNPLLTSDGNNAWSALLDTHAHTVRSLNLVTNSFCAGKSYLCLRHLEIVCMLFC